VSKNYLNNAEHLGTDIPWPDLRYIFGEIMYGGHITDPWDRRVNNTYLAVLIIPDLLVGGNLAPGFKSPDSSKLEYIHYQKYIEERFPMETPQMYGMHPNAEIGYLTNQGVSTFMTISAVSGGGGGGGGGDISAAQSSITLYQGQLPPNLDMLEIRGRVTDKSPFVIVSLQESDRMNILLSTLRQTMTELELGITGALNVTESMEKLAFDLIANKVTANWLAVAYPCLKTLSAWFADLCLRVGQLDEWTRTLVLLKSVWLSGLFNSMSFLTSNMQVTARKEQKPLDYLTNRTRFYNTRDLGDIAKAPPDGVNVHGLFLEGAGWEDGKGEDEGYITESKMKDLHPVMPISNIFPILISEFSWEAMYTCPVFSTTVRGGILFGPHGTFMFLSNVRMDPDDNEIRWVLAGAAMLTQDD
jgi:dynein heavy chain